MKSIIATCLVSNVIASPVYAVGEHEEVPGERVYSGRLVAKPKPRERFSSPEDYADFIAQLRSDSIKILEQINAYVVPGDEDARRELEATGQFEYVEHDWLLAPAELPNDPLVAEQWYIGHLGAPTVWAETTVQESFPIAICDSGIELGHPDLART